MDSKENRIHTSMVVKPEPQDDSAILPLLQSTASNRSIEGVIRQVIKRDPDSMDSVNPLIPRVKTEATDAVDLGFTRYKNVTEIIYTPENALTEGLRMVKALRSQVKELELGSKLREEVWRRDIDNLQGQTSPKTLIAVCGATGAGKSSILNAVLDDNIVPTSGMRACTAVVTEIAYHKKSTIDADISFLTREEWRDELGILMDDLVDEDGNLKRTTDLKSDAGVAWQKVHAVYPNLSAEKVAKMNVSDIIEGDADIASILGTTKQITAKDSKVFAKEIAKYIDSKDQDRGKKDKKSKEKEKEKEKGKSLMDKVREEAGRQKSSSGTTKPNGSSAALWPLIRQVNVRCNASALSTGAILVDLPGVADANAARNNIAKDYMKKCACIWILAPITRAVDDKTARDLLGDAFKMQLMNGNYDSHTITFIASKCDDISCSEVIRALNLYDDPELEEIDEKINTTSSAIAAANKAKTEAKDAIDAIDDELKAIRERITEYERRQEAIQNGESYSPVATPAAAGKKRKNSRKGKGGSPKRRRGGPLAQVSEDEDSDSDDSMGHTDDEDRQSSSDNSSDASDLDVESDMEVEQVIVEETAATLADKIEALKETIKERREMKNTYREKKKDATDSAAKCQKELAKLQRQKNAFCSLKRSEFSRDVLKEDFRVGLKDLDDAAAEERDPNNFDPTKNLRDYDAIDLPVFTCSSRDYVRLKGQVKGDGGPACFSNINDTGIPALQEWCHQLTFSSRQRVARNFFNQLRTTTATIDTYVRGIGDVTAVDRAILREKWGSDALVKEDDSENPFSGLVLGSDGLYSIPALTPKREVGGLGGVRGRLLKELAIIIDSSIEDLQKLFRNGLEDKCRTGATNAAAVAIQTSDTFAASMHWATYRATLRRHGSFRQDLNVELLNPFTRNIASSWGKVFETDLFAPFEKATVEAINKLIGEIEVSAPAGLKDKVRAQGELCISDAKVSLRQTVDQVRDAMQTEQKEISRSLAPHVQEELVEGYDRAMEERGIGSVARQKASFHNFVASVKDDIFEDGADVVLTRLEAAAESVGTTLDKAMEQLVEKVEVNLAALWEESKDNPTQVKIRKRVVEFVAELREQAKLWLEAEVLQRTSALEASPTD